MLRLSSVTAACQPLKESLEEIQLVDGDSGGVVVDRRKNVTSSNGLMPGQSRMVSHHELAHLKPFQQSDRLMKKIANLHVGVGATKRPYTGRWSKRGTTRVGRSGRAPNLKDLDASFLSGEINLQDLQIPQRIEQAERKAGPQTNATSAIKSDIGQVRARTRRRSRMRVPSLRGMQVIATRATSAINPDIGQARARILQPAAYQINGYEKLLDLMTTAPLARTLVVVDRGTLAAQNRLENASNADNRVIFPVTVLTLEHGVAAVGAEAEGEDGLYRADEEGGEVEEDRRGEAAVALLLLTMTTD